MTDALALDRQVCFAIVGASRAVVSVYKPILEPLGLTHPQYLVMLALWQSSPRRVKDLGETLFLDSATLSPLLKRLERQGLVTRTRDPLDERALAIALTDAGASLRAEAEKVPAKVVARLGLSVAELEGIRDASTSLPAADRAGRGRCPLHLPLHPPRPGLDDRDLLRRRLAVALVTVVVDAEARRVPARVEIGATEAQVA